jgi:hypothetical protein
MDCFRIENASTWMGDPGRNLPPCFYRHTGEIRGQIDRFLTVPCGSAVNDFTSAVKNATSWVCHIQESPQTWSLMSLPAISQVNYLDPRGFPTYTPSEVCCWIR